MLTVLFDGVATGALLFLSSVGLSVTLGVMNFVNLAHGVFAMVGGYVSVLLLNRLGVPFLATLPAAFLSAALFGLVTERLFFRRLYAAGALQQVLFTTGLVFAAMAAASFLVGSQHQIIQLPRYLSGQVHLFPGFDVGVYRLFLVVFCGAVAAALQYVLGRTRYGSRLRAAVDNTRVANGMGIDVGWLFAQTFAVGAGLAGLGAALGAEILNLDPSFPFKYLVYFLIVVAAGGTGTITGPLAASLVLGICDVAGKYYLPEIGAFIIYGMMVAMLLWRPQGLFGRRAAR